MQALERSFSCSFPLSSNAAKWNDEKTNVLQRLWFHTSSTQSHASAQWRFDTIQDKTALLLQINGDRTIHERDNMRCFSDKRKGDTRITIRKKKISGITFDSSLHWKRKRGECFCVKAAAFLFPVFSFVEKQLRGFFSRVLRGFQRVNISPTCRLI